MSVATGEILRNGRRATADRAMEAASSGGRGAPVASRVGVVGSVGYE